MKIYVGNLSYRMTSDELQQLFAQFGQVDKVDIIIDRETGKSKGFGFIEMPVSSEAEAAIKSLHGTETGGRTLTVNQAKPKTDAPRRPSRPPRHG
ncbi:RNA recognition motif domain-containing protein [Aeromonas simiae]|nr:RNA-binding protein [Aeromonas simiae]